MILAYAHVYLFQECFVVPFTCACKHVYMERIFQFTLIHVYAFVHSIIWEKLSVSQGCFDNSR